MERDDCVLREKDLTKEYSNLNEVSLKEEYIFNSKFFKEILPKIKAGRYCFGKSNKRRDKIG